MPHESGCPGPGLAVQTQQGPLGPPLCCWTVETQGLTRAQHSCCRGQCPFCAEQSDSIAASGERGAPSRLLLPGKAACDAAGVRQPVAATVRPAQAVPALWDSTEVRSQVSLFLLCNCLVSMTVGLVNQTRSLRSPKPQSLELSGRPSKSSLRTHTVHFSVSTVAQTRLYSASASR